MPLHLLKLCVGVQTIGELEAFVAERVLAQRRRGESEVSAHITRVTPRRIDELLDGGSIFWVIKGRIAARQNLAAIESFVDADGIGRCRLELMPHVVAVAPRPCRAFQGWRYLPDRERPPDIAVGLDHGEMPEELRRTLCELGLL